MKPIRIQMQRKKGWHMPASAVFVGRPTKWGNPYIIGEPSMVEDQHVSVDNVDAVKHYTEWLFEDADGQKCAEAAKEKLKGKDLVCYCKLDQVCHGDVLLRVANEGS